MMTQSMNKKKESQKKNFNREDDTLSNLPNEILTKILSFLETKEVVRTGILSNRWKSVWLSVPNIDLDQDEFRLKSERSLYSDDVKNRFSKFMDQLLLARKFPSLEKLRMWCTDPDRVISWLQAALERDVRELVLYVFFDNVYPPPCELAFNVSSYSNLVVLKLNVSLSLYFPTIPSCFPNLKVLKLCGVYYENDESLPNLLSGCPVLEKLTVIREDLDNMGTLYIRSRSLKILKVRMEELDKLDREVDLVVIDAPAVEFLDYDVFCDRVGEHVVKDLSSLVGAELSVRFTTSHSLFKFLAAISDIKVLKLHGLVTMDLIDADPDDADPDDSDPDDADPYADPYNLPIFQNLTRLEIYGSPDAFGRCYSWSAMLRILKSSPFLETLILHTSIFRDEEVEKSSKLGLPSCLISHLKTIELQINSSNDIEMAMYFLTNAQVLEKMTIHGYSERHKSLKFDTRLKIAQSQGLKINLI